MTRLELAGVERVDELKQLWLDLHHHHQAVAWALPLVEDDERSWQRRRALYLDRLGAKTGFVPLRAAVRPAVQRAHPFGPAGVCALIRA